MIYSHFRTALSLHKLWGSVAGAQALHRRGGPGHGPHQQGHHHPVSPHHGPRQQGHQPPVNPVTN